MYSRKVVGTICSKIRITKQLGSDTPSLPSNLGNSLITLFIKYQISVRDSMSKIKRGFQILYHCINTAYFDTSSQMSIVNTIERNGIIHPESLQAAIQSFEKKQDYLYLLMKTDQYENLIANHLPTKLADQLKDAKAKIMSENFEDPNRPGYTNEGGQRVGMFLNRGAVAEDLRKHEKELNRKPPKRYTRFRSKIEFPELRQYTVKQLYLDFASKFKPSKALHVHMMNDNYAVTEWEGTDRRGNIIDIKDDHLDFATGKTFSYDRITLCTDYARNTDIFNEKDYDMHPSSTSKESNMDRYFVWRNCNVFSGSNEELERIIPNPAETFNGPYFTLPSSWDKMVRSLTLQY